jgi:hypothetical protein
MEICKKLLVMLSRIGLPVLLLAIAVACQGRFLGYKGVMAKEESRIVLLEGGPHTGTWKTGDLSIDYRYQRDHGSVELSGTVELDKRLVRGFPVLEYLTIQVHILGVKDMVLESKRILASEYRHITRKLLFNQGVELPHGSAAITFSYRGRVRDVGGSGRTVEDTGGGDSWDFWVYPFQKEKGEKKK